MKVKTKSNRTDEIDKCPKVVLSLSGWITSVVPYIKIQMNRDKKTVKRVYFWHAHIFFWELSNERWIASRTTTSYRRDIRLINKKKTGVRIPLGFFSFLRLMSMILLYGDPSYAKHFDLSIQGQVSASILFLIFSSADFCSGKKLI